MLKNSRTLLKLFLLLLLLSLPLFSAYSQDANQRSDQEPQTVSLIIKQLYRISIEQAKKSASPETELEKVYNQIITELETYYLNEAKKSNEIYQAQLIEQKTSSDRRVQEVQDKANQELALLKQESQIRNEYYRNNAMEKAGWFSAGLLTGYSLNELKDDLLP